MPILLAEPPVFFRIRLFAPADAVRGDTPGLRHVELDLAGGPTRGAAGDVGMIGMPPSTCTDLAKRRSPSSSTKPAWTNSTKPGCLWFSPTGRNARYWPTLTMKHSRTHAIRGMRLRCALCRHMAGRVRTGTPDQRPSRWVCEQGKP